YRWTIFHIPHRRHHGSRRAGQRKLPFLRRRCSRGLLPDETGHGDGLTTQRLVHVLRHLGRVPGHGPQETLVERIDVALTTTTVLGTEVKARLVDPLETPHGAVGALGHLHEPGEGDRFGAGERVLTPRVVVDQRRHPRGGDIACVHETDLCLLLHR